MGRKHGEKKPKLSDFKMVCEACRGNKTKIAKAFQVSRMTVLNWCNKDPKFNDAVEEYSGILLDECLNSARLLALGIPDLDANGKIKGWKERPDGFMLKYLIGKFGRNEGFGESIDITTKGEKISNEKVVIEVIDSRDKIDVSSDGESEEENL